MEKRIPVDLTQIVEINELLRKNEKIAVKSAQKYGLKLPSDYVEKHKKMNIDYILDKIEKRKIEFEKDLKELSKLYA